MFRPVLLCVLWVINPFTTHLGKYNEGILIMPFTQHLSAALRHSTENKYSVSQPPDTVIKLTTSKWL